MKRLFATTLAFLMVMMAFTLVIGEANAKDDDVVKIKDGILVYGANHYLAGEKLKVGYDAYGYNYQGHMFKGFYANVYLGGDGWPAYDGDDKSYLADNPDFAELEEKPWYWPWRSVELLMKWNDAWLSNVDRDNVDRDDDGKLDRHYGHDSYIGSGAWVTNHMKGEDNDGKWTYFTKIVAAPDDATKEDGVWYAEDGTEIGPVIWGHFAQIQVVESGSGATYVSPCSAGLGYYK